MRTVDFKDLGLYSGFLEDFGNQFKYLHVEYEGELGWFLVLTTETFTEYFRHTEINNWYEIGIVENCDHKEILDLRKMVGLPFERFYEVVYE